MESKKCSNCKIEKDFNQFNKDKNKKGGVGNVCKDCNKLYMNSYYQSNKERLGKETYKNKQKNKVDNREKMFEYLNSCECKDCGNSDVRVLEFDHIGKKKRSVNQLLQEGRGWNRILEEIELCEVVCSNCHKIRTYSRMESYRNGKNPVVQGKEER